MKAFGRGSFAGIYAVGNRVGKGFHAAHTRRLLIGHSLRDFDLRCFQIFITNRVVICSVIDNNC